ncbi:unnamed protein product [Brachionus calyciflorus]|uniref:Protein N-terminal glutamine amidohydrolase n=1 Tax=Brachionus calyciflorus TaxID=104777 RepID=A0A813T955_9BILA|nr:unnamed protein product [Brachionus calyciflorus]
MILSIHLVTGKKNEENVWKLLKGLLDKQDRDDLYAVFISNKNRSVPIWCQKASEKRSRPVVWDYHVIAIHKDMSLLKSNVYDFDTILNFPEPFESYAKNSFPYMPHLPKEFDRLYRVIPAKYYISNFASDRSHMINKQTGEYQAEPPIYECIKSLHSSNNIQEFIEMDLEDATNTLETQHGVIMRQNNFFNFFTE